MVVNTVRPTKKNPVYINTGTASMYRSCIRGLSCSKCGRRRCKEAMENSKSREKSSRKGTLLDAFRKAVNALDELDLVPRTKKPRVCRHRPAALTIYVRKRTEKVYNAVRLNQKTIEELKGSLGEKYNFSASSVTSFKLCADGCQRQSQRWGLICRNCICLCRSFVRCSRRVLQLVPNYV